MLRSVKYGLYGAVLAGLVGGTVAWTNIDKTVDLVVDGHSSSIHTAADSVGGVLKDAGYHPGVHDILAPSAKTSVHDGSKIVFARGRLLNLNVDGRREKVWTTAPTVAAAMGQLGYSTADFTSVSRSRRLPLSPTDIAVRTPRLVTVVHDGKTEHVSTTDGTVAQLLADLGIKLDADDRVTVPTTSTLQANAKVVVQRVTRTAVTSRESLPFPTEKKNDSSLVKGDTKLVQPGKNGLAKVTYAVVYVNGKVAGRTKIKTVVLRGATPKIVRVGTKAAPAVTSVSPGSAQALAKKLLGARGWGSDQFDCLVTLWNHESGWRVHASNASGAYGIPQALPGSKMASVGSDWQDSAETQIKWGLNYISSRYRTPCGAWSQWQANGGWY